MCGLFFPGFRTTSHKNVFVYAYSFFGILDIRWPLRPILWRNIQIRIEIYQEPKPKISPQIGSILLRRVAIVRSSGYHLFIAVVENAPRKVHHRAAGWHRIRVHLLVTGNVHSGRKDSHRMKTAVRKGRCPSETLRIIWCLETQRWAQYYFPASSKTSWVHEIECSTFLIQRSSRYP